MNDLFIVNTIPTLEIKTRKVDDPPTFRVNLTPNKGQLSHSTV